MNKVNCVWSVVYADGDTIAPKLFATMTAQRTTDGQDTVLINLKQNVDKMELPMSYAQDEDVMHFWIIDEDGETVVAYDEIKVSKTNTPVFESVDCDPRFNHVIKGISTTNNIIDSVVVVKDNVTNVPSNENIRIYLKHIE